MELTMYKTLTFYNAKNHYPITNITPINLIIKKQNYMNLRDLLQFPN